MYKRNPQRDMPGTLSVWMTDGMRFQSHPMVFTSEKEALAAARKFMRMHKPKNSQARVSIQDHSANILAQWDAKWLANTYKWLRSKSSIVRQPRRFDESYHYRSNPSCSCTMDAEEKTVDAVDTIIKANPTKVPGDHSYYKRKIRIQTPKAEIKDPRRQYETEAELLEHKQDEGHGTWSLKVASQTWYLSTLAKAYVDGTTRVAVDLGQKVIWTNFRPVMEAALRVAGAGYNPANKRTYAQARNEVLDYLEREGWAVSNRKLKMPHATSPDGELRLWFKAQAVHFSYGNVHRKPEHSLWTDIRSVRPEELVQIAYIRTRKCKPSSSGGGEEKSVDAIIRANPAKANPAKLAGGGHAYPDMTPEETVAFIHKNVGRNKRFLIVGPYGSAKIMVARRMAGLLPPLNRVECGDLQKIYEKAEFGPVCNRPFRAPHHSVSTMGMVGFGNRPVGELSLATHGTLLLDEVQEFKPDTLEAIHLALRRGMTPNMFPARPAMVIYTATIPKGINDYHANQIWDRIHKSTSALDSIIRIDWSVKDTARFGKLMPLSAIENPVSVASLSPSRNEIKEMPLSAIENPVSVASLSRNEIKEIVRRVRPDIVALPRGDEYLDAICTQLTFYDDDWTESEIAKILSPSDQFVDTVVHGVDALQENPVDEGELLEKLSKLKALQSGTTSAGEREAARLAAERIRGRLAEMGGSEWTANETSSKEVTAAEIDSLLKEHPAMRRAVRAGTIPMEVKRYYKQIIHSQPEYTESKAWATAWSIYCKHKEPRSVHCKKPTKEYLKLKTSAKRRQKTGYVGVKAIYLELGEYLTDKLPQLKPLKVKVRNWTEAEKQLDKWQRHVPKNDMWKGNYVVEFPDGESYGGKLELRSGGRRRRMRDDVRSSMEFWAGMGSPPAGMTKAQYDRMVRDFGKQAAFQQFLKTHAF